MRTGQSIDEPADSIFKWTAMHYAVEYGHDSVIELLVQFDSQALNKPDHYGRTPLHLAMARPRTSTRMVQKLISYGSDVNMCDQEGKTPLHLAALYSNIEMVQILISYGADIDARDNEGKTPLYMATICHEPNKIVEQLLISGSCAASRYDINKRTPLIAAVQLSRVFVIETLVRFDNRVLDIDFKKMYKHARIKIDGSTSDHNNALNTLVSLFEVYKDHYDCRGIDEDTVADVRFRIYFAHSLVYRLVIMTNC
jgi:hypothetical protein